MARAAEGDHLGVLELHVLGALEQFGGFWVRSGLAALDVGDAEIVQRAHDAQLVLGGELNLTPLRPVAKGGVKEFDLLFHHKSLLPRGASSNRSICASRGRTEWMALRIGRLTFLSKQCDRIDNRRFYHCGHELVAVREHEADSRPGSEYTVVASGTTPGPNIANGTGRPRGFCRQCGNVVCDDDARPRALTRSRDTQQRGCRNSMARSFRSSLLRATFRRGFDVDAYEVHAFEGGKAADTFPS